MRNQGRNKSRDIRRHFKTRYKQRIGSYCSDSDIDSITNLINSGQSKCVLKESNTKVHHELEYQGRKLLVVYDRSRKTPVTCWEVGGKPWWEKI